jgi:hypothetical protein
VPQEHFAAAWLESGMMKTIPYFTAVSIVWTALAAAQAQGISNARDGSGNLVERGAATRTYPSAPVANSAAAPTLQANVAIARRRTIVIRRRR